jgi:hypothetical protein
MKKLLRIVGLLIAVPVALLGIAVAAALYLNDRAEREAGALCTSIEVGSTQAQAVTLGRARGGRHSQAGSEHRFFFQGWVFNGAQCVVQIQAGKVVSASAVTIED